jgi:endoglucanase
MGNYTTDQLFWGRPEDITMKRPYYGVPSGAGASDISGALAAALAATSLVWRGKDPVFAQQLMTKAYYLYSNATQYHGRCEPCNAVFLLL